MGSDHVVAFRTDRIQRARSSGFGPTCAVVRLQSGDLSGLFDVPGTASMPADLKSGILTAEKTPEGSPT